MIQESERWRGIESKSATIEFCAKCVLLRNDRVNQIKKIGIVSIRNIQQEFDLIVVVVVVVVRFCFGFSGNIVRKLNQILIFFLISE